LGNYVLAKHKNVVYKDSQLVRRLAVSILSEPHFHNEEAAYERLESIVWPDGPVCPHCGNADPARIYRIQGKTARMGLRTCAECREQFRVTVNTIFEHSKIPLHKWFQAAHLMSSSKKGISAHLLHRTLQVTYKTAWFMGHRLREAMRDGHFSTPLGGEGKTVEMDETFVGGLERNKHRSKRKHAGTGGAGKEAVMALVERGGTVRSQHVPEVTAKTLGPIIEAQLHGASFVYTDEGGAMKKAARKYDGHQSVNHSLGEYVRGDVHTNTIEGYFSILKRGINGTYHHVSQRHLKRYLAEFDFRYNARSALGVEDAERTTRILSGIAGKRLTYLDSSAS
jgi:transposase-like protein